MYRVEPVAPRLKCSFEHFIYRVSVRPGTVDQSEHKLGVSYGRVLNRTRHQRASKTNTCSSLHRTDLSIARRRRIDWATPRRADDFSVPATFRWRRRA